MKPIESSPTTGRPNVERRTQDKRQRGINKNEDGEMINERMKLIKSNRKRTQKKQRLLKPNKKIENTIPVNELIQLAHKRLRARKKNEPWRSVKLKIRRESHKKTGDMNGKENNTLTNDDERSPMIRVAKSTEHVAMYQAEFGADGIKEKLGLDTMASHTVIPPKLFNRLKAKYRPQSLQSPLMFSTASGKFYSKQYLRVPIRIHIEPMQKPMVIYEKCYKGSRGDDLPLLSFSTLVSTGLLQILAHHYEQIIPADRKEEDNELLEDIAPLKPSWGEVLLAKTKDTTTVVEDVISEEELPSAWPKKLNEGKLPTVHNDDEMNSLAQLMTQYRDLFPDELPSGPHSHAKIPPLKIRLIDERQGAPKYRKPRRLSRQQWEELRKEIEKLLKIGVIVRSDAPAGAQMLLVRKPDGSWRAVIDYRPLNAATISISQPLPRIDHTLGELHNKTYFCKLDLRSGYWQIRLHKKSQALCTFVTPHGSYKWVRMPMGLKQAAGYFQASMREVLDGLIGTACQIYLDDVLVAGNSIQELHDNLRKVLDRFRQYRIYLKASKCEIAKKEVEFLGHIVNGREVKILPERIDAIKKLKPPKTRRQLRGFLGMVGFARQFLPNFAKLARPLTKLLSKDKAFKWGEEQQKAFEKTKELVTKAPILTHFQPHRRVVVQTDASETALGAVLLVELKDGKLHPVEFISKAFNEREEKWATPEKEAFAIFYALNKWQHYLAGIRFEVFSDHKNLAAMDTAKAPKLIRWRLALQPFDYEVTHISGEENKIADGLSRYPSARATRSSGDKEEFHPMQVPKNLRPSKGYIEANRKRGSRLQDEDEREEEEKEEIDKEDLVVNTKNETVEQQTRLIDIQALLKALHNPVDGHRGVKATIAKLEKMGIDWVGRRKDVSNYIRRCDSCQLTQDKIGKPRLRISNTSANEPFQMIMADLIGPFPADKNGNTYVLSLVDVYSRFTEMIPIRDKSAESTARGLLSVWGRYGGFQGFWSDLGREFHNATMNAYINLLKMERYGGIPYRHEAQGLIEIRNRHIQAHVRALIWDNPQLRDEWALTLPIAQRIINATVLNLDEPPEKHVTPIEILFAVQVTPDRHLFKEIDVKQKEMLTEASRKTIRQAMRIQKKLIKNMDDFQKKIIARRKDKEAEVLTEFVEGQHVLLAPPEGERPPDKLAPKLKGPYVVTKAKTSKIQIKDLNSDIELQTHGERLRPFYECGIDPAKIAARSSAKEYIVDCILKHRLRSDVKKPSKRNPKHYEFLVSWADYPSSYNSYEPYHLLRKNEALDDYLDSLTDPPKCLIDDEDE